jgi:hypothetical protein
MKAVLNITGIGLGALLIGTTLLALRKKSRDQRARALLAILQVELQPASSGLTAQNAFDIHYLDKLLQTVQGEILVLKKSTTAAYAKQLHSAFKPWYQGGDDEDQVYSVFRRLKDKVQVAQVAQLYQEVYSKNLIDTLRSQLEKKEITRVLHIVKALPNYRIA